MGDPCGIGPEILVKALSHPEIYQICRPLIIGDATVIHQALTLLHLKSTIHVIDHPDQGRYASGTLDLINRSFLNIDPDLPPKPSKATGCAMQDYILFAIDLALKNQMAGMVTCPITKTALKLAGSKFHGHTELLAHYTGTDHYAMMLAGKTLKVVLVTIHIPLSQVAGALSIDTVLRTIHITHSSLQKRFHLTHPRIAVAGLNPHSGESSLFGNEEEKIISPAIRAARETGIDVHGPLPPDTVFHAASNGQFDAVVCMYHDQGLIPFKLLHFKDGVNTTLGLPIIRTSVDHGTAYDIAWKGKADPESLIEAIKMAAFQAKDHHAS